jgi:transposase-like protein
MIENLSRKHKRPIGISRRMDETFVNVNGAWKYLCRAIDLGRKTFDFHMTAHRGRPVIPGKASGEERRPA